MLHEGAQALRPVDLGVLFKGAGEAVPARLVRPLGVAPAMAEQLQDQGAVAPRLSIAHGGRAAPYW